MQLIQGLMLLVVRKLLYKHKSTERIGHKLQPNTNTSEAVCTHFYYRNYTLIPTSFNMIPKWHKWHKFQSA